MKIQKIKREKYMGAEDWVSIFDVCFLSALCCLFLFIRILVIIFQLMYEINRTYCFTQVKFM